MSTPVSMLATFPSVVGSLCNSIKNNVTKDMIIGAVACYAIMVSIGCIVDCFKKEAPKAETGSQTSETRPEPDSRSVSAAARPAEATTHTDSLI